MNRRRIVLAYWVIALAFFTPSAVFAYIDPATTTYIIQIITALVVTAGVSLSVFLYRFRMISAKLKYGLYGLFSGRGMAASQSKRKTQTEYILPPYAIAGSPEPLSEEDMKSIGEPADMEFAPQQNRAMADPGKRSYAGRLKAALPVILGVCLSFILFGCIDLAAQNAMDMPFRIIEAVPVIAVFFAVVFVLLLFVVPLFRGSLFEIILSLAVSLLIAGYIQGNYLNMGLGELTGDQILWDTFQTKMVISAIVWIALFAAIFLLHRFAKPTWRGLTVLAPFLLIIVQAVALVSVLGESSDNKNGPAGTLWGATDETLSVSGIDELSATNNAIIFVLDRLDEEYVEAITDYDPSFFDRLDGFTKFEDNISYYVSTFPSVTSMLTGHRHFFERPRPEYFEDAWAHAAMMHEMKNRGVDIRLYMARGYTYDRIEQLEGLASNILVPEYDVSERIVLVKLLKLSGFRYAPMPLKRIFWLSPTEFADAISLTAKSSPYITNDMSFYDMLTTQRLKKLDTPATFTYYHLTGAHDPITIDENIQLNDHSTPSRQAAGAFKIVYEYLDQMKALGLYDGATIIITGDHGMLHGDDVYRPALTGLFVKPAGAHGTPLAYNEAPVCPDELLATIMQGLFGEDEDFGATYFDIKEDDSVTREYISDLKYYEIKGDGRDFSNWTYLETLANNE
ncbi:MAG: hypothetical protein LBN12_03670 [Clostridiales Family XIII bacterium]|jgi:hypothetical protein|nr:hypothetical protein [Clostridiales Family XIII bacterium]